jgi:hypothetical protein
MSKESPGLSSSDIEAILADELLRHTKDDGNPSGASGKDKKPNLQKIPGNTNLNVLDHIKQIVIIAKDAQNEEEFQNKAKENIEAVSRKLKITPVQAVIFSHMIDKANDDRIYPSELKGSLRCTTVQLIRYLNDFEELEDRNFISQGKDRGKKCYQIPPLVIDALRHNKAIKIVEFNKPTLKARKAIWKSQLPELCYRDAETIADRCDFSGGQIENIVRKRTVDSIIHAGKIDLATISEYCYDEKMDKAWEITIGFRG